MEDKKTGKEVALKKKAVAAESKATAEKTEKTVKKEKVKTEAIEKPKESAEALAKRRKLQARIKAKKKHFFNWRFEKKLIRKKSNKDRQKWRKPRGIDIKREAHYGLIPDSGYGLDNDIRFLHPSGLKETRIANLKELESAGKETAIRIKAGIGKKKRKELVVQALKRGYKVLN